MFEALKRAMKIPTLRKRILFTAMMLVVFRIGASIPTAGMDTSLIKNQLSKSNVLSLYDMMSGGALSQFTLFALGVTPYITSSIVMQLLTVAIPSLEELQKSGEDGRKKISEYTRYLSVALALFQSFSLVYGMFRGALLSQDLLPVFTIVITLTAGTTFLMWLGEIVTEKGIGNGVSMIIYAGIISRYPISVKQTLELSKTGAINPIQIIVFLVVSIAIIIGVIMVLEGVRKIPVQYAKRVIGKNTYGGQSSHIPLKVNQAGVIPVIFASSVMMLPEMMRFFVRNQEYQNFVQKYLSSNGNPGIYIFSIIQFVLVFAFSYFYISITFQPDEVADNLKNGNGFIPGIRPGKPTADYIAKSLNRLTFVGAVFLSLIAALPTVIYHATEIPVRFGGTSLLIVVGVAIETMRQIKAQSVMRQYQGFLK
ncbi:preprotein translocase, SecY subunit [Filifactor alocis ATCC 35896]|uniref:Protein translocase subunit SecY n=1 Tax=Filifactor alocis (strain ATCC 35896 / CCUG 47790 / D40 B5) TaxID=546269 RepID=D6GQ52_FILAD|nr:preprotein translocase subunit SecY [Filifactor alocis]EFE28905.1 preprotein translocase, SecY subunit [Filifactor alocis ATCC 35896]